MPSLFIIDKNLINMGAGPENIFDPRQGQQGDLCFWEIGANTADCRSRHDGITNPVGGANQDVAGIFWNRGHGVYYLLLCFSASVFPWITGSCSLPLFAFNKAGLINCLA